MCLRAGGAAGGDQASARLLHRLLALPICHAIILVADEPKEHFGPAGTSDHNRPGLGCLLTPVKLNVDAPPPRVIVLGGQILETLIRGHRAPPLAIPCDAVGLTIHFSRVSWVAQFVNSALT
jgi:hypothetical protein